MLDNISLYILYPENFFLLLIQNTQYFTIYICTRKKSCFFFLFLVIFNSFLTIPVVARLALAIPVGAPIILVNEMTFI